MCWRKEWSYGHTIDSTFRQPWKANVHHSIPPCEPPVSRHSRSDRGLETGTSGLSASPDSTSPFALPIHQLRGNHRLGSRVCCFMLLTMCLSRLPRERTV